MPHFGLMNADGLDPGNAALQRARLHIRGGKRRLRQGKVSAAVVTFYDALDHALEWYIMAGPRRHEVRIPPGARSDSRALYEALSGAGIITESFDYDAFDSLTERCLHEEAQDLDGESLVASLEAIMTALGVMPFDEAELPPEDPATF